MLNTYNQLLIMSVVAGGLCLMLKLLSALTLRYFTAAWHYYSYFVLGTFFLIPYHKWLSGLDLNFITKYGKGLGLLPTNISPFSPIRPSTKEIVILQEKFYPAFYSYLELLPYFLMAGTLIFLAVIFVQNYKLNHRIFRMCELTDDIQILKELSKCKQKMGITQETPIYISPSISTPFLSGIIKPRIILPNIEFHTEELQCVFLHELTHWKRYDVWLKYLMLLINAIHWFNPLVYMARREIDRFCELSCDEFVVKSMNNQERRRYCELMLNVLWNVADQRVKLFSTFSDKRKHLERRVSMILKNETSKCKIWIRTFSVVMTLALVLVGTVTTYAASSQKETVKEQTRTAAATNGEPEVERPPYSDDESLAEFLGYDNTLHIYRFNGKWVRIIDDRYIWDGKIYGGISRSLPGDKNNWGEPIDLKTVRNTETNKIEKLIEMSEEETQKALSSISQ